MQRLILCALFVATTVAHAQLPASSPSRVGFDAARLDVLHAITKRFVDEGKEERIFAPLGMKDTAFDVPPEKMSRLARTYKHGAGGKGFVEAESLINTEPVGSFAGTARPPPIARSIRRLVAIAFAQHFPYNQHNFFSKFTTGYFQALK